MVWLHLVRRHPFLGAWRGTRVQREITMRLHTVGRVVTLALALLVAPLATKAQLPLPVIGYLSSRSPSESAHIVAAFRQGLQEAGFVEGQNVVIESRFAEGHFDRLPALAAELVRRPVQVLVATGGTVSVVKAKPVVPATIPIVFAMGGAPVKLGVVASLARPGGNITGVSFLVNELAAKTVELLHELVPKATVIGFLVNPNDPNAEPDTRGADSGGRPRAAPRGGQSQHRK